MNVYRGNFWKGLPDKKETFVKRQSVGATLVVALEK